MDTAQKIRQARLAKGFTQEDLARAVEVGVRIVTRWENGKAVPRMKTLARIAKATGHTVEHFGADELAPEDVEAANASVLENLTAAVLAVLQVANRETPAPPAEPERFRVFGIGEPGRPWADPNVINELEETR